MACPISSCSLGASPRRSEALLDTDRAGGHSPRLHNGYITYQAPASPGGRNLFPSAGDAAVARSGNILEIRSLRLQVYEYLRELLNAGDLRPGSFLDLPSLEGHLGISRTPLRDALLRLESEGFVEILPRRGVQIAALTLGQIRHIYQMVGALEGSVLGSLAGAEVAAITPDLQRLNRDMIHALETLDYDRFYERNTAFHDSFLNLSDNNELVEYVRIQKQRLYDFPRRHEVIREWEERSTHEHDRIIGFLADGDVGDAAAYLRDVHWSFDVQSLFVRKYYGVKEGGPRATP